MHHWLRTEGHPIVYVNSSLNRLILRQERYFSGPQESSAATSAWSVSLTVLSANGKKERIVFDQQEASLPLVNEKPIFADGVFCRICFSEEMFDNMMESIHLLDNFSLLRVLSDSLELARAGRVSTLRCLRLSLHPATSSELASRTLDLYSTLISVFSNHKKRLSAMFKDYAKMHCSKFSDLKDRVLRISFEASKYEHRDWKAQESAQEQQLVFKVIF